MRRASSRADRPASMRIRVRSASTRIELPPDPEARTVTRTLSPPFQRRFTVSAGFLARLGRERLTIWEVVRTDQTMLCAPCALRFAPRRECPRCGDGALHDLTVPAGRAAAPAGPPPPPTPAPPL